MPPLNLFQKKCLALAIGQSLVTSAQAATIIVDSNTDNNVGCTLREALGSIGSGNGVGGCLNSSTDSFGSNDTIVFAEPGTIALENGELIVTRDVTIDAATVRGVTIDAQQDSRVMNVVPYVDVTLDHLTITRGVTPPRNDDVRYPSGAGIIGGEGSQITINNSTISGNSSANEGGGIYLKEGSVLQVSNSVFSNNEASNYGGGISADSDNIQITVFNSTFNNNKADYGAGISSSDFRTGTASSLTVTASRFTNNVARVGGGAIHIDGRNNELTRADVSGSTISRNTVSGDSGAHGGGISAEAVVLTVSNSTISGNSAIYGYDSGGRGGGIYAKDSSLTVTNSTLSGNVTDGRGGGIAVEFGLTAALINTTVSDNTAAQGAGALYSETPVTLTNSILANSIASVECDADSFTSDTQSIVEDGSCGGAARTGDPGLLPLANNGGPTQTHKPGPGSPAINTGDNATCTATDQRGQARLRTNGDACDVGAVELGAIDESSFFVIPTRNGKTVIFEL